MFGFITGGFKFLKWLIPLGIIAVIAFLGWNYHQGTQGRITSLLKQNTELTAANATYKANEETYKQAIETANETVTAMEETYERIREDYTALQGEFQVIRLQNDEPAVRLGRHELDGLASRKPALVETRINNATEKVFRCLELQSGAPLNESERNADTAREFNSECPWLWVAPAGN